MVTDNTLRLEVHQQINNIFIQIVDELPQNDEGLVIVGKRNYLSITNGLSVVEYGLFCKAIYEYISIYIPNDKENPLRSHWALMRTAWLLCPNIFTGSILA